MLLVLDIIWLISVDWLDVFICFVLLMLCALICFVCLLIWRSVRHCGFALCFVWFCVLLVLFTCRFCLFKFIYIYIYNGCLRIVGYICMFTLLCAVTFDLCVLMVADWFIVVLYLGFDSLACMVWVTLIVCVFYCLDFMFVLLRVLLGMGL